MFLGAKRGEGPHTSGSVEYGSGNTYNAVELGAVIGKISLRWSHVCAPKQYIDGVFLECKKCFERGLIAFPEIALQGLIVLDGY